MKKLFLSVTILFLLASVCLAKSNANNTTIGDTTISSGELALIVGAVGIISVVIGAVITIIGNLIANWQRSGQAIKELKAKVLYEKEVTIYEDLWFSVFRLQVALDQFRFWLSHTETDDKEHELDKADKEIRGMSRSLLKLILVSSSQ